MSKLQLSQLATASKEILQSKVSFLKDCRYILEQASKPLSEREWIGARWENLELDLGRINENLYRKLSGGNRFAAKVLVMKHLNGTAYASKNNIGYGEVNGTKFEYCGSNFLQDGIQQELTEMSITVPLEHSIYGGQIWLYAVARYESVYPLDDDLEVIDNTIEALQGFIQMK